MIQKKTVKKKINWKKSVKNQSGFQSVDKGRLGMGGLSKQEHLDEDRVFSYINLEGIGSPSTNGLND